VAVSIRLIDPLDNLEHLGELITTYYAGTELPRQFFVMSVNPPVLSRTATERTEPVALVG
jgi:hypothetical protein